MTWERRERFNPGFGAIYEAAGWTVLMDCCDCKWYATSGDVQLGPYPDRLIAQRMAGKAAVEPGRPVKR